MRWIVRILLGLVGLVAALVIVLAVVMHLSLPTLDGEAGLSGLAGEARIVRDRQGLVTIHAGSMDDAYRALGYAHAQDRMWQMEMTRRIGAGRLAELLGGLGLGFDRYMRTLGLYGLAEQQVDLLSPEARAAVEAYVEGVNAWLETRDVLLPPEYQLLFADPEPWTLADSLVWGRLMAFQLSTNMWSERRRARLAEVLSPQQLDDILPANDPDAPVTLPSGVQAALQRMPDAPEFLRSLGASNAWVLDGGRTESGRPILANDPHLGFSAPNLWYFARIVTPELTLVGVTVPGVPFHLLGHNGRIAWGLTTTYADTQDLFIEEVGPDGRTYRTPDGWAAFETRTETLGVRFGDPVEMTVRRTRHGPVVSDLFDVAERPEEGAVVALAFPGLEAEDTSPEALYRMNHATDWRSFLDAMRHYHAPVQNVHYADVDGNIGLLVPGRIPVRKAGDGLMPVDGASGDFDWVGYIPFEELPRVFNPASGRIESTNNRLVDDRFPHLIAAHWPPGWRARRLKSLLDASPVSTPEDSAAWQLDTVSTAAAALAPVLTRNTAETEMTRTALALLRAWDHDMAADRPEPLIYSAWVDLLARRIAADETGDAYPARWDHRERFLLRVFGESAAWCNDVDTPASETCPEMATAALEDAVAALSRGFGDDPADWRWADAHRATFENRFLGRIPLLKHLANLTIATPGGDHTLSRGQSAPGDDGMFRHVHGAGFRAVYDLADLDRSLFSLAGGQSAHFLSPHYGDLLIDWRDGRYFRKPGRARDIDEPGDRVLTLKPAD